MHSSPARPPKDELIYSLVGIALQNVQVSHNIECCATCIYWIEILAILLYLYNYVIHLQFCYTFTILSSIYNFVICTFTILLHVPLQFCYTFSILSSIYILLYRYNYMVPPQNVERQNIDRQNVERQNVENWNKTKRRKTKRRKTKRRNNQMVERSKTSTDKTSK
jgi:hypothetical protein